MRAVLITGFNNWGKTTHIKRLFNRPRFYAQLYSTVHAAIRTQFLVEPRSNDDLGEKRFIDFVAKRCKNCPKKNADLLAAFCPSRESTNDSLRILQSPPFRRYDEIHLFLLRYKWDWHAELRLAEVQSYLSANPRVTFDVVDADSRHTTDPARLAARDAQIGTLLAARFP